MNFPRAFSGLSEAVFLHLGKCLLVKFGSRRIRLELPLGVSHYHGRPGPPAPRKTHETAGKVSQEMVTLPSERTSLPSHYQVITTRCETRTNAKSPPRALRARGRDLTFLARFTACGNDLVMTYARTEVLPFPGSLSLEILRFAGPGDRVGRGNDLRPGGGL